MNSNAIDEGYLDDRHGNARWRSSLRQRLTRWFDANARDLPWRKHPTPYNIWVSEIMLQQTQVATVIPYYERFIKTFPHVDALADADPETLMMHWKGLGYYRRAQSMQKAAKQIVDRHRSQFPTRYKDVLALTGIGRYTAGAILSIACDARLPILEANTVRTYARWTGFGGDVKSNEGQNVLWDFATKVLPRRDVGRFNQAAMELGALICKPKPLCDQCPVKNQCAAREFDRVTDIPGKVTRIELTDRREYAFVIADRRPNVGPPTYLIHRRPHGSRWAGLWDFPRPIADADGGYRSADEALRVVGETLGRNLTLGPRQKSIRHGVTRYRIVLDIHHAQFDDDVSPLRLPDHWTFESIDQILKRPMPVSATQIAKSIRDDRQRSLFVDGV